MGSGPTAKRVGGVKEKEGPFPQQNVLAKEKGPVCMNEAEVGAWAARR